MVDSNESDRIAEMKRRMFRNKKLPDRADGELPFPERAILIAQGKSPDLGQADRATGA
jgi:hypothetical protein